MAMSAHEWYLLIRIRNEGIKQIDNAKDALVKFGLKAAETDEQMDKVSASADRMTESFKAAAGFITAGSALFAAGKTLTSSILQTADAYEEYAKTASATFTQVDDKGTYTLEKISKIGRDVAKEIPVAFKDIQPALFDIFSSMEVGVGEAEHLIRVISKAAVGGTTTVEDMSRSIIGIMNAWGKENYSAERAADLLFQTYRDGVGSVDEFGRAIGLASSSATIANQDVEQLGGMLAFMTRNNITAARAGTAAARAFDAIVKPKTIDNMKEFGVEVRAADGSIRPMNEIMADLKEKIQALPLEEQNEAMQNLFKGSGGTTQAMRFLNAVIGDSDGLYQSLTKSMYESTGAAEEAFQIMKDTPEAKLQLLSNTIEDIKITFGETATAIKMAVVDKLQPLLTWFTDLSPEVQDNIVKVLAFAGAAMMVVGALLILIGLGIAVKAAFSFLGTAGIGFGMLSAKILLVIAVVALFAAAVYLVIEHWDTIGPFFTRLWDGVKEVFSTVVDFVTTAAEKFVAGWMTAKDYLQGFADDVKFMWGALASAFGAATARIGQIISEVKGWLEGIKGGDTGIAIQETWNQVMRTFEQLGAIVSFVFNGIFSVISAVVGALVTVFMGVLWPVIVSLIPLFMGVWEAVVSVFQGIVGFISNAVDLLYNIFTGNLGGAIEAVKNLFSDLFKSVINIFANLMAGIAGFVGGIVTGVIAFFQKLFDVLVGHSIIPDMVKAIIKWFGTMVSDAIAFVGKMISGIIDFFLGLPGKAINAVMKLLVMFVNFLNSVFSGAANAVSAGISNMISFFSSLPGKVLGAVGGLASSLYNVGRDMIQGMINGITGAAGRLVSAATGVVSDALGAAKRLLGINSPSKAWAFLGDMSVLGFEEALDDGKKAIAYAGKKLANASLQEPDDRRLGFGTNYGSSSVSDNYHNIPDNHKGSVIVNQTINTQEINPIKQAADLGYEIARRVNA